MPFCDDTRSAMDQDMPASTRGNNAASDEVRVSSAPTMKAFAVLQVLARSHHALTISVIADLLGMPKPTTHRIVRMLESEGMVRREMGGHRFGAGQRLRDFAFDILGETLRRAPLRAVLDRLSRQVGETCNLGIMVDSSIVYIERVETTWPFGLRFEPGSKVPVHCTAIGKLFLSFLPQPRQQELLGVLDLTRHTDNTITDPTRLSAELARIRDEGVSTDNEEFLVGVVCLAVPVTTAEGQIIAGLAISAPSARLSMKQAMQQVPSLRQAARTLSGLASPEG